jgi:hypothetical protein
MDRRRMLAAAIVPLLHGCYYEREYPLSWDEEVLLHDGRMIIVRVTRYFTRSTSLPWLQTNYFLKDMEIAFDAGPPWGRYQRRFPGYQSIEMIENKGGNWYLLILGDPGKHRLTDPRYPFWIVGADGSERAAKSQEDVPRFPLLNVLPYVGPQEEFFRFASGLVRWQTKMTFWRNHPRAPGDVPEQLSSRQTEGGGSDETR